MPSRDGVVHPRNYGTFPRVLREYVREQKLMRFEEAIRKMTSLPARKFGFSDRGYLYCINAENGQTAWTDTTQRGRGFAAIVDAGSCLLALPSNSELVAFMPTDERYEQLALIKVSDTSTYAHPVVVGKRILVKDEDAVTMWTVE